MWYMICSYSTSKRVLRVSDWVCLRFWCIVLWVAVIKSEVSDGSGNNVAWSRPPPAASDSRSRNRSGGTAIVLRGVPSLVGWYRFPRGFHGPCGSSAGHAVAPTVGNSVLSVICSWCWRGAMDDTRVVMNVFIIYLQRRAHASRRRQSNNTAPSRKSAAPRRLLLLTPASEREPRPNWLN